MIKIAVFQVDFTAKRRIERLLRKTQCPASLRWVRRLLAYMMVLVPAGFLIYAYSGSRFVMHHDRYGTLGQKNSLLIATVAVAAFALLFLLYAVVWILSDKKANRNTKYRFAESLLAEDGLLVYSYKNYMQSFPKDLVVVKMRLNRAMRVRRHSATGELLFIGEISSVYYEDYENGITQGKEEFVMREFSLYEYFTPSLYDFLTLQNMIDCGEETKTCQTSYHTRSW